MPLLFLSIALPVSAQVMTVRRDSHHDVSAVLVDMRRVAEDKAKKHIQKEADPLRRIPLRAGPNPATGPDPVLQSNALRAPAESAPTTGFAFEGLGDSTLGFGVDGAPPDTNGAV